MRKLLMVLAVLASVVAATVSPAKAVTGNYQEDFDHPYVVLIAFWSLDWSHTPFESAKEQSHE